MIMGASPGILLGVERKVKTETEGMILGEAKLSASGEFFSYDILSDCSVSLWHIGFDVRKKWNSF